MVDFVALAAKARAAKIAQEARTTEGELILDDCSRWEDSREIADIADSTLAIPAPIKPVERKPIHCPAGYTAIYGSVLSETDKAILFSVRQPTKSAPENKVRWWIPISQIYYIQRSPYGTPYKDIIHVKQWILDKNVYIPCPESKV